MQAVINKIYRRIGIYCDIFKTFGRLITGSVLGYILVLFFSPFLTRFYSPEEFGLFSVYGALIAIFSTVGNLSFEFAILGANRRTEAMRFSFASLVVAFFVLIFSAFFVLTLNALDLFKISISTTQTILAFAGCYLTVFMNVAINWAIKANKSSAAALASFLNLSMRTFLQIALGYFFGGLYGLVFGDILGRLIGLLSVDKGIFQSSVKRFLKKRQLVFNHIKKNAEYVYHLTPANAIETSLVWLSAPLLALYYDPFIAGVVAMVQRIGFAPISLINQTLGQIFHLYTSKLYQVNNLLIIRTIFLIIILTMPLLIFIYYIFSIKGRAISEAIFGDAWGDIGDVFCILLPLYYMYFLSLLTNKLIIIMSRNYIKLVSSIIQLLFLFLSLPLAIFIGLDWSGGLLLQTFLLGLIQLVFFIFVLILINYYPSFGSIKIDYFFKKG